MRRREEGASLLPVPPHPPPPFLSSHAPQDLTETANNIMIMRGVLLRLRALRWICGNPRPCQAEALSWHTEPGG